MAAAASAAGQAVEKQLKICGVKRNVDVLVLYLAGQGLRSISSLSRFHRLRYLWINNNKIQDLTFLVKNYCLTELYLNNNELTDISGTLKHLRALRILLLHNNQLKNLGKTVKELKGMISLQALNLFHNPLAQDPDYRLYVIYFLPSIQLLDRKSVTQRERESALHLYNRERSRVAQSIAFGRRVNTPLGTTVASSRCTQPARRLMSPPGCEFGNHTNNGVSCHRYNGCTASSSSYLCRCSGFARVPFENPEDAVFRQAMTRSIMQFSCVDWNKVPTRQERQLENKAKEPHEKLTLQLR